jgi:hypothetical protein
MAASLFTIDNSGSNPFYNLLGAGSNVSSFVNNANSNLLGTQQQQVLESSPPVLKPPGDQSTTIDVVNDFYWTYSKKGTPNRLEVPTIYLREKRLKTNSLISQIKSSFGASIEGTSRVIDYIRSSSTVAQGIANSSFFKTLQGLASNLQQAGSQTFQNIASNSQVVQDIKNATDDDNFLMNNELLKAYKDLYITEPTKFTYALPYFEDYLNSSNNQFGEDSPASPFASIASGIAEFATFAGIAQRPFGFSFQERAKFYNFPQSGESLTVSFPLINTGSATFDDVIKNWQLIFLLLYQNKPSRLNRTVIEPPVLYQVEIPGQKFLPYCYISEMQVSFKGSRRTVNFALPQRNSIFVSPTTSGQSNGAPNSFVPGRQIISEQVTYSDQQIEAIIPDAYQVRITLQSLVAETKNFMAYTYNLAASQNIVNVTDTNGNNLFNNTFISDNALSPQNTSSTESFNNLTRLGL